MKILQDLLMKIPQYDVSVISWNDDMTHFLTGGEECAYVRSYVHTYLRTSLRSYLLSRNLSAVN